MTATASLRLLTGSREPVRVATTAALDLTQIGGRWYIAGLKTIDGVTLAAGDRVLVKNGAGDDEDATWNGIYEVSSGPWRRAGDARDSRTLTKGVLVPVQDGSLHEGTYWRVSSPRLPNLGDDAIAFAQVPVTGEPGIIQSIQAGNNVSVDATDPANPVISATGEGDVTGPASSADGRPALFDGTTGKLLKEHGAALGTAAAKDIGASGDAVPLLNVANEWSAAQTFPHFTRVVRTENNASAGPNLDLERISASPAANDALGQMIFYGYDSIGTKVAYGVLRGVLISPTGGASDGAFDMYTAKSGTVSFTCRFALGVYHTSALGGDKGANTINFGAYYCNGIIISPPGAPVTKTANFTVADTEKHLINNKSGSACTVTLPTPSSWPGREITIKNVQAQTVISASSNVVPLAGGAAGTAILAAVAGRWATLVSDGTSWVIMAGVP